MTDRYQVDRSLNVIHSRNKRSQDTYTPGIRDIHGPWNQGIRAHTRYQGYEQHYQGARATRSSPQKADETPKVCTISHTCCIMHKRAHHAPCTPCTQCHTILWQATAMRHPISARLQQQHIAEQGEPSPTESAKPLSGSTRRDSASQKAKKVATDRTSATKKDASHLEERDVPLAKAKKKKKKVSIVETKESTEEPTEEPTDGNDGVSTPPYTAKHSCPGLGTNHPLPQMYDGAYREAYEDYEGEETQLSEGEEPGQLAEGTEEDDAAAPR